MFETGLGGGVRVFGSNCPEGLDGPPNIRSLASWYMASRSARVLLSNEDEVGEVFEGVVVCVGRFSIFIGAWMTVDGGGETTVVEVDGLEITSCGIGDFVFLTTHLNQSPPRGGRVSVLTRFPRFSDCPPLLLHRHPPSRLERA